MKFEGGFQGRTNKLVDSCYSFWQGAAAAMLEVMKVDGDDLYDISRYQEYSLNRPTTTKMDDLVEVTDSRLNVVSDSSGSLPFNQSALQKYILLCAQNFDYGGMRDKPGKSRDFYHCCYSLSGLSVSQRSITVPLYETKSSQEICDGYEEFPTTDRNWKGPQVSALLFFHLCFCIMYDPYRSMVTPIICSSRLQLFTTYRFRP